MCGRATVGRATWAGGARRGKLLRSALEKKKNDVRILLGQGEDLTRHLSIYPLGKRKKEKSCGMQSIMGVNDMDNIRSYYSFYPLSLNTGGAKLGKDLLSLNSFREVNIHSYLNPDFSI